MGSTFSGAYNPLGASSPSFYETGTASAYDCCVFAFTMVPEAEVFFYGYSGFVANDCIVLATSGDHEPQVSNPYQIFPDGGSNYVIGNGYSGEFATIG